MDVKSLKVRDEGILRASFHLKQGCHGPRAASRYRKSTSEVPTANELQGAIGTGSKPPEVSDL